LGIIDFLVIWKLILTRSLRSFHYTFLIVFVVAFFVMALFVTTERLHPLGLLVRWYQQITGHKTNSNSLVVFLRWGEVWMAAFLGFALACAMGSVAAWLERRRGWDIAAFLRGALIGCVIGSLPAIFAHAAWRGAEPLFVGWIGAVVQWACILLGGLLGLSRMKSRRPDREGHNG
jgi:FtsH-binding integral membrane protein